MPTVDASLSGRAAGIFLAFLTKGYEVVERVCFDLIRWGDD
jgi:hypothetical protein